MKILDEIQELGIFVIDDNEYLMDRFVRYYGEVFLKIHMTDDSIWRPCFIRTNDGKIKPIGYERVYNLHNGYIKEFNDYLRQ